MNESSFDFYSKSAEPGEQATDNGKDDGQFMIALASFNESQMSQQDFTKQRLVKSRFFQMIMN